MWHDAAMRGKRPKSPDDVSTYLERDADEKSSGSDVWDDKSREVFELQLEQLGTQLSDALIQKQALEAELERLEKCDLAVELAAEKDRNLRLCERIEKLEADGRGRHFTSKPVSGFDGWETIEENSSSETSLRRRKGGNEGETKCEGSDGSPPPRPPSLLAKIKLEIADRLADFTDDDQPEKLAEDFVYDYPLTYKRLKSNLKRFTENFKLVLKTIGMFQEVLTWKNPLLTFLVFIIYMYSVWTGYLLHVLLLLCIGQLAINWLHAGGIGRQLGFGGEEGTEDGETTEKNKMQLVLTVARHVQNKLALVADGVEKIKNLLMWRHREAGKKLFSILVYALVMVLFVSPPTLFRIAGLGLGIKLFIISTVFRAFPKVERRYGSMSQLYRSLPTDAHLKAYNRLTQEEKAMRKRVVKRGPDVRSLSAEDYEKATEAAAPGDGRTDLSAADVEFCRRLVISPPEPRLPPFGQKGLVCTLLDKGKTFQIPSPGRLHLTHSFLCWERAFAKNKAILEKDDYILIPLCDVTSIKKAKPISFVPGKGFSLEIDVIDRSKPHLFGAIPKRDEAYEAIIHAGKMAGLEWATAIG